MPRRRWHQTACNLRKANQSFGKRPD